MPSVKVTYAEVSSLPAQSSTVFTMPAPIVIRKRRPPTASRQRVNCCAVTAKNPILGTKDAVSNVRDLCRNAVGRNKPHVYLSSWATRTTGVYLRYRRAQRRETKCLRPWPLEKRTLGVASHYKTRLHFTVVEFPPGELRCRLRVQTVVQ